MTEELSLLELMEKVGELFSYNELCRLSTEQLEQITTVL